MLKVHNGCGIDETISCCKSKLDRLKISARKQKLDLEKIYVSGNVIDLTIYDVSRSGIL